MRCRLIAAAGLLAQAASAQAQFLPPDQSLVQFRRDVVAGQRALPGYDQLGIRIGTFKLTPSIEASGNYNDNVLALDTPRQDDAYLQVAPSVSLQSDLARDSLNLSAGAAIDRFAKYTSENREAVNVSGYGIKELGTATRVRLYARFEENRESRESQNIFALTQRPIRYQTEVAGLGITQRFNNLQVAVEGGYARYKFFDARFADGTPFDQSYRDADQWHAQARAEIAQSPSLAYFAQVSHDWTNYDEATSIGTARDAKTLQALGGVRFELPVLARGEVGIGYVRSDYRADRFRSFSGLAISSRVVFFPTQLTTVTVDAQRQVNDAGQPNSSGYVVLRGGAQVDHELLRQLILSGRFQAERDTYNGVDRRDRRYEAGASAEYRLRNGWRVRLAYDFLDLASRGIDRYKSFSRNRLTLALRYAL